MADLLPEFFIAQLKKINPASTFSGYLPKVKSSAGQTYFVKSGLPEETEQFIGEARSLEVMGTAAPGLVPQILAYGIEASGKPYFISEYKVIGGLSDTAARVLAKRLATELHQSRSTKGFGFDVPTYCGATRQRNGWYQTWEECYGGLIGNLLERLSELGYGDLVNTGEQVREQVIPALLGTSLIPFQAFGEELMSVIGKLSIEPVILHGDLWSGNAGVDSSTGEPIIFDPSSYYGHNEADLAIARVFGGFPQAFYETYHEHCPKTEPVAQYALRAELYELYHYLNHTVLFGGGYARSAQRVMAKLLSAIPNL